MKSMTQVMQNLVKPYIDGKDTQIGLRIDQLTASKIGFDGTPIGYSATKTQAAIEEADGKIEDEITARENADEDIIKTRMAYNVKNRLIFNGIVTGNTTATTWETKNSLGKVSLKTGDKIVFVCTQDSALTSSTRNTLVISPPNADAPQRIFEDGAIATDYHNAAGLHIIRYTATADGEYDFGLWTHTLSSAITYSKFMVCSEDDYDLVSDYEGASMTNVALTGSALNEHENGAVNLLVNELTAYSNTDISATVSDGVVTFSGTASQDRWININDSHQSLKKGRYKLSGCPASGNANTYTIYIAKAGTMSDTFDTGDGAIFDLANDTDGLWIGIRVKAGTNVNGVVFKPMITRADYPFSDYAHYVPYAMSNRELTEVSSGTTDMSEVTYSQRGKIVVVHIFGANTNNTETEISGLPVPLDEGYLSAELFTTTTPVGYIHRSAGKWSIKTSNVGYGSLTYLAK